MYADVILNVVCYITIITCIIFIVIAILALCKAAGKGEE